MSAARTHSRTSDLSSHKSSDRSGVSRSSSGGRTSTRSDVYSSDYSDDFDTEAKSEGAKTPKITKLKKNTRSKPGNPYTSNRLTNGLRSSGTSRKSYAGSGYGNLRKRASANPVRYSRSAPKVKVSNNPKKSSVARHVLTAKQQEISELQNRLFDAKQKLETAQKENKLLKTLQHRQDKDIRKFENAENDLPRLISRNFDDQRVLKSKLRKTQETKRTLETKLNENNDEILKMEGVLRRLKQLVYDKNLGERSELSKQLSDTENSLTVSERKIQKLDKKLELTIASYTRHLNTERQKHKDTRERMEKLHEEYMTIDSKLKEKERALNVSNIYAMRKRNSYEKALVPVKTSTPKSNDISSCTQTDPALTSEPELKGQQTSHLHSDVSGTTSKKKEQKATKTSIFLTTDFDSPPSSPNSSFVQEATGISTTFHSRSAESEHQEEEDAFADTLRRTEKEIQKLQIALKQKASLLAKMNKIDSTDTSSPTNPSHETAVITQEQGQNSTKTSPKTKAERVQSLFGNNSSNSFTEFEFLKSTNVPVEESPKKPEREISFGSYAPTVGVNPPRRKPPVGSKSTPKRETPTQEVDEPLFDLTSGKQNKKSNLLTQLFGNQDGVLANGSNAH